MLKAVIVHPNEKTTSLPSILRIATSAAKRREHGENLIIKAARFIPECNVYCVIYEVKNSLGVKQGKVNSLR